MSGDYFSVLGIATDADPTKVTIPDSLPEPVQAHITALFSDNKLFNIYRKAVLIDRASLDSIKGTTPVWNVSDADYDTTWGYKHDINNEKGLAEARKCINDATNLQAAFDEAVEMASHAEKDHVAEHVAEISPDVKALYTKVKSEEPYKTALKTVTDSLNEHHDGGGLFGSLTNAAKGVLEKTGDGLLGSITKGAKGVLGEVASVANASTVKPPSPAPDVKPPGAADKKKPAPGAAAPAPAAAVPVANKAKDWEQAFERAYVDHLQHVYDQTLEKVKIETAKKAASENRENIELAFKAAIDEMKGHSRTDPEFGQRVRMAVDRLWDARRRFLQIVNKVTYDQLVESAGESKTFMAMIVDWAVGGIRDVWYTPPMAMTFLIAAIVLVLFGMAFVIYLGVKGSAEVAVSTLVSQSAAPLYRDDFSYRVATSANSLFTDYPYFAIVAADYFARTFMVLAIFILYREPRIQTVYQIMYWLIIAVLLLCQTVALLLTINKSAFPMYFIGLIMIALVSLWCVSINRTGRIMSSVTFILITVFGLHLAAALYLTSSSFYAARDGLSKVSNNIDDYNNFVYDHIYKNAAFLNALTGYDPATGLTTPAASDADVDAHIKAAINGDCGIKTLLGMNEAGTVCAMAPEFNEAAPLSGLMALFAKAKAVLGGGNAAPAAASGADNVSGTKALFTINFYKNIHNMGYDHPALPQAIRLLSQDTLVLRWRFRPSDFLFLNGTFLEDVSNQYGHPSAALQSALISIMDNMNAAANDINPGIAEAYFSTMTLNIALAQWLPVVLLLVVRYCQQKAAPQLSSVLTADWMLMAMEWVQSLLAHIHTVI